MQHAVNLTTVFILAKELLNRPAMLRDGRKEKWNVIAMQSVRFNVAVIENANSLKEIKFSSNVECRVVFLCLVAFFVRCLSLALFCLLSGSSVLVTVIVVREKTLRSLVGHRNEQRRNHRNSNSSQSVAVSSQYVTWHFAQPVSNLPPMYIKMLEYLTFFCV